MEFSVTVANEFKFESSLVLQTLVDLQSPNPVYSVVCIEEESATTTLVVFTSPALQCGAHFPFFVRQSAPGSVSDVKMMLRERIYMQNTKEVAKYIGTLLYAHTLDEARDRLLFKDAALVSCALPLTILGMACTDNDTTIISSLITSCKFIGTVYTTKAAIRSS